LWLVDYRLTC
jgi:hypothetical protein